MWIEFAVLSSVEKEKALRELGKKVGASELDTYKSNVCGDLGKMTALNGRLEVGSSSTKYETSNVQEQSLVRHRSRHVSSSSVNSTTEIEDQLAAKEASLPQELTSDGENELTLQVRMLDGSRNSHRFAKSDKLQSVFDFIDVGGWVKPDSYSLVRPYPRLAFSAGEIALALNELGFTGKEKVIFLELI